MVDGATPSAVAARLMVSSSLQRRQYSGRSTESSSASAGCKHDCPRSDDRAPSIRADEREAPSIITSHRGLLRDKGPAAVLPPAQVSTSKRSPPGGTRVRRAITGIRGEIGVGVDLDCIGVFHPRFPSLYVSPRRFWTRVVVVAPAERQVALMVMGCLTAKLDTGGGVGGGFTELSGIVRSLPRLRRRCRPRTRLCQQSSQLRRA